VEDKKYLEKMLVFIACFNINVEIWMGMACTLAPGF
jgi:hypothetical protein